MPESFDQEDVRQQTEKLVNVVTSEPFKQLVVDLARYPEDERRERAAQVFTVDGLRARGVTIPEGLRISPRVFESPEAGAAAIGPEVIAHTEQTPMGWCVSLGQWLCVSYGQ